MSSDNAETRRRKQCLADSLVECGFQGDAEAFARRLRENLSGKNLWVGPTPKPRVSKWRPRMPPRSWL